MDLSLRVTAAALLASCANLAPGDDRAAPTRVSMRWPSTGDVVASSRPRVRWATSAAAPRTRVEFCADRACARRLDAVETDGSAAQPTRALPQGVVFWRAYEAGAVPVPSGPVWWFIVPAQARDEATLASREYAWSPTRDVDGDGRWDPLDLHGVLATGAGDARAVSLWLSEVGSAPVTAVGDLDGDGYVDFAGADAQRGGGTGQVFVWDGPLHAGANAPSRAGRVVINDVAACGAWPTLSGDFDADGRRELVVTCPEALATRGEVYIVAHDGPGLGRTVKVIRAEASGVRLPSHARMRALLVDDLDDDGYDDLVVSHPSARCEYVPSERYCIPVGWLAVYRGGVGGLDAHPPWVYAPGDLLRGPGLGLAAVRVAPTLPVPTHLWVGSPLASLTLARDGGWEATERFDVPFRVERLFAAPTRDDPSALLLRGDNWFLRTGERSASQLRAVATLPADWRESFAEFTDTNGDGEADLVLHAEPVAQRRTGVFVAQGDGTGRFAEPALRTR